MNAVIAAVGIMLILSLSRVHVVIALIIGALAGGLVGGLGTEGTLKAFNSGLGGGATVALSYALLGPSPSPSPSPGWPTPWPIAPWRWSIARGMATRVGSSGC